MAERKQNGKKETKHVNNAESKNQKEQIKKQETKKKRETTFLDRCMGVETQKHGGANKDLKADGGWGEDGFERASESPAGVHTVVM